MRSFAGVLHYEKVIKMGSRKDLVLIDLGRVHGVSGLTVNGKRIGHCWYGNHRYDISKFLEEGENVLRISVTTTLGNYLKSSPDNTTGQRWTVRQPYYPAGLVGPVKIEQYL
jgi:hypothetical protein